MLGESLLVAPILEEGQTRRSVYLPAGRWSDFWDEQVYSGPGEVEIECGLEYIPVFVRQGSLLPVQEENRLVMHIFAPEPGKPALFRLFSDEGDGSPIPGEQEFRLDDFHVLRDTGVLEFTWQNSGHYPFPYPQVELELHNFDPSQANFNGLPLQIAGKHIQLPPPEGTRRTIIIN
jgi:alpha-glucosidase